MYLYTDNYYVFFSCSTAIKMDSFLALDDLNGELLGGSLVNHYYLGGGYQHKFNDQFDIRSFIACKNVTWRYSV